MRRGIGRCDFAVFKDGAVVDDDFFKRRIENREQQVRRRKDEQVFIDFFKAFAPDQLRYAVNGEAAASIKAR